jgi:hypothetical protein
MQYQLKFRFYKEINMSQVQYYVVYDASLGLVYNFESGPIAVPPQPLAATTLQQIFVPVAADPVSPVGGQVWYNTTSHAWKGYNGTSVVTFTAA